MFVHVCTCRWEELNLLAEQRGKLLSGAEQVHKFVRDAAETNDRMNEKVWGKCIVTMYMYMCLHSFTCIMEFVFTLRTLSAVSCVHLIRNIHHCV